MSSNSRGKYFTLTTFGESHGPAMGGVIDGCPAGVAIDLSEVQDELNRRRPGQSSMTSPRNERDQVEILSGIFEGRSTGSPIGFIVRNADQRSADYDEVKKAFRPSHADYTYDSKYGFRDYRGGGRASARETLNWVVGGAIARQVLAHEKVDAIAWTQRIGTIEFEESDKEIQRKHVEASLVRCPDSQVSAQMEKAIESAQSEGNTLGGCVEVCVNKVPAGWGDPVFRKLHAELGHALFSINAVKAVEFGSGVGGTKSTGKDQNDAFQKVGDEIKTLTNNSGGIQGGISNGSPITIRVHFKPVATIASPQQSVNQDGEEVSLEVKGRHDACVIPRAVPIVEAMVNLVLVDAMLASKISRIS
jgi:chorismate synthase